MQEHFGFGLDPLLRLDFCGSHMFGGVGELNIRVKQLIGISRQTNRWGPQKYSLALQDGMLYFV